LRPGAGASSPFLMTFTVAIDGPAASGKGTIARAVAAHFGFAHLDTGLLYRGVGFRVMQGEDPLNAAENLVAEELKNPELRGAAVSQWASKVAVLPEVRAALLDFQRAFARRLGGAVLDGRDIGTVICPAAEAKLFVTASDATRARRRHKELLDHDPDITFDTVLSDLRERDRRDSERSAAPLVPADDAILIDTSDMSIDAAVAAAIAAIANRQ